MRLEVYGMRVALCMCYLIMFVVACGSPCACCKLSGMANSMSLHDLTMYIRSIKAAR